QGGDTVAARPDGARPGTVHRGGAEAGLVTAVHRPVDISTDRSYPVVSRVWRHGRESASLARTARPTGRASPTQLPLSPLAFAASSAALRADGLLPRRGD